MQDKNIIIAKEVRCSFPQLYGKKVNGDQSFDPSITIIMEKDKHAELRKQISQTIAKVIEEHPVLKKQPPKADKRCVKEPEDEQLCYLPGNVLLKAGCKQPPVVLFPDGKTIMTEETNKIYSGCYVNVKFQIWGQANQYGKRVNAKLIAVQYVPKAADSFDGSYIAPEKAMEGFESLESDGGAGLDDTSAADSADLLG